MIRQTSPTTWEVPSRTHADTTYEVTQCGTLWACRCPSNTFRRRLCPHIIAVWERERTKHQCPACRGAGVLTLKLRWLQPDLSEAPATMQCLECSGSGRREAQEKPSLPSDTALREIFR
jgi:hypothetical protein